MDIPQEDDYNEIHLKKKVLNAGEFFGSKIKIFKIYTKLFLYLYIFSYFQHFNSTNLE